MHDTNNSEFNQDAIANLQPQKKSTKAASGKSSTRAGRPKKSTLSKVEGYQQKIADLDELIRGKPINIRKLQNMKSVYKLRLKSLRTQLGE